jgi:hypothetical protein
MSKSGASHYGHHREEWSGCDPAFCTQKNAKRLNVLAGPRRRAPRPLLSQENSSQTTLAFTCRASAAVVHRR